MSKDEENDCEKDLLLIESVKKNLCLYEKNNVNVKRRIEAWEKVTSIVKDAGYSTKSGKLFFSL